MTRKFGDLKIPPLAKRLRDIPEYEDALVTGLRRHALAGDRVVIVGGGWGVTAVIAALAIGESGSVVCFEGAEDNVEKVRWAASRSGVADRLNVMHAVVGASIQVYSEGVEGTLFEPEDLPECDLLQLDCEGAEIPILMRMKIRPRAVIVETHGFLGSSTNTVERLLVDLGYRIVTKTVAESSLETMCVDRDVFVVVGLKE
ncbi:FkbM family methyltransferase [Mesorhizobium sp.]|uniref:FkbM family methyltransferase n=1 Tax=Mesorhizobium sp. TaxID=1871066 RepID=UPI00257948A4|nr:FkbM family methyltransferase [Mesorhizobium sp.]